VTEGGQHIDGARQHLDGVCVLRAARLANSGFSVFSGQLSPAVR